MTNKNLVPALCKVIDLVEGKEELSGKEIIEWLNEKDAESLRLLVKAMIDYFYADRHPVDDEYEC